MIFHLEAWVIKVMCLYKVWSRLDGLLYFHVLTWHRASTGVLLLHGYVGI
jgi:hypothetical protein